MVGLHGDRLKVRLAAVPEKGAANRELIAFLARALNLPRNTFPASWAPKAATKWWKWHDPLPDLAGPPGRSPGHLP